MQIREFIKANRLKIDCIINSEMYRYDGNGGPGTIPDPPPKRNDEDRRQWILCDENLYRWAKANGVVGI